MPDQLKERRARGPVPRLLALVLGGVLVGALLGVVWEAVWQPPSGAAYEGEWYLAPDGLHEEVSATAWFALLGVVGGVGLGTVAALLGRDREIVTLLGVCVGSVVAAWVMFHVGNWLGPSDPHVLARDAGDLVPIPGDLRLAGADTTPWPFWFESGAFSALPFGSLLGMVGIFFGGASRRQAKEAGSTKETDSAREGPGLQASKD